MTVAKSRAVQLPPIIATAEVEDPPASGTTLLAKALLQGARGKGAPQDPLRWRARRGRLNPSTRPLKSTEGSGLLPRALTFWAHASAGLSTPSGGGTLGGPAADSTVKNLRISAAVYSPTICPHCSQPLPEPVSVKPKSERIRQGLDKARQAGVRLGRPRAENAPDGAAVRELREKGRSWGQIARRLKCTPSAAQRAQPE